MERFYYITKVKDNCGDIQIFPQILDSLFQSCIPDTVAEVKTICAKGYSVCGQSESIQVLLLT
jgi:hypothetical protein